jgi:hypothetical protein
MILVIGNTPQKVELKDLGDYIYYKQQKIFTDSQYNRSQDLQREIQKGSLTILKRADDKSGSFDIPSVGYSSASADKSPVMDFSKLDTLLERINSLEESINAKSTPSPEAHNDVIKSLIEKVTRLESELIAGNNGQSLSILHDAIKKLEDKVGRGADDAIFKKLEDILNRAPVAGIPAVQKEEMRPEDVYVPTVTVEDANTHIKLDIRTIGGGDDVNDSLKKLKELKSKS